MSGTLLLRYGGNLLELSSGGTSIPRDLYAAATAELQYDHVTHLRGQDVWHDPVTGEEVKVKVDRKVLYRIDDRGRFIASLGWKNPLLRMAENLGYRVDVQCVDPPHPRPNRYETDWVNMFRYLDLRVKQDEILAAIDSVDHGILDVVAGVGKTFLLAAYCLAHPRARVHVVTEGIDIINRIHRHLSAYLPNVGMVGGGHCEFGQVTVISADSLHKVAEGFDDPHSPRSTDVVFFDEVHKAATPSYLNELIKYRRCRMYGMSANVDDRADNADKQLRSLFGEVIYTLEYPEAERLGLVCPVRVEWVNIERSTHPLNNLSDTAFEKWAIWNNQHRNSEFARVMQTFDDQVQCLVMVSKVEHAVRLKQFLPEYKLCYGSEAKDYKKYINSGELDSRDEPPMTPARRAQMREAFERGDLKKVIATDVWSTGVDFAPLSILGRADGRDSRIMDTQIPCRANRIFEGKSYATIIDCMDNFDPGPKRKSQNRRRAYLKMGWTQHGATGRRRGGAP